MLRVSLLLVVLLPASTALIATPEPITSLLVDANPLPSSQAGTWLEHTLHVTLEGPTNPTPGASTPIELTLHAPSEARCTVPDEVTLDPLTGQADATLSCRPIHTGNHSLTITAKAPPHEPGTWQATLTAKPDTLTGTLETDPPDGYEIPLTVNAEPDNLDTANATLTLHAHLDDQPLGFHDDPTPVTLTSDWITTRILPALHGPGTYQIMAHLDGPHVKSLTLNGSAYVPEPPSHGETTINVTVEEGQPTLRFQDDSVNRNGVNKRPGDRLITRLATDHADEVNVTVHRAIHDRTIPLHETTLPVEDDGTVEHVFQHPILPTGTLYVTATAGTSNVTRTASIQDLNPDATVHEPSPTLADGRTLQTTLVLEDRNHGSTSLDPGPIWGLPDVEWTIYKGSSAQPDWNVAIGPYHGAGEGSANTSTIPWPGGLAWATTHPGTATMPLDLTPPLDVEPGTYRVSIYEHEADGSRSLLDSANIELTPPPRIQLDAQDPRPGEPLPVQVNITDHGTDTLANVTLTHESETLDEHEARANTTIDLVLPEGLPAGSRIHVNATGSWQGRPAPASPDASLSLEVQAVPPRVGVHPVLDGAPTEAPVAIHPAHNHTLEPLVSTLDPNGDPVTVDLSIQDPEGTPMEWVNNRGEQPLVEIPAWTQPGRYELVVTATSPSGTNETSVPLEVGEITRIGVHGNPTVRTAEGDSARTSLTVVNTGTVPVEQALVSVDAPEEVGIRLERGGVEIKPGTLNNWTLAPGEEDVLDVEIVAHPGAEGAYDVRILVAGVIG